MISTFITYLETNKGFSVKTAKAYEASLKEFALFINTNEPGTRWSTVTKQQIDDYVSWLSSNMYSASTIKQRISALRTFFTTCRALGANIQNPARYVSTPKLAETLPKAVGIATVNATLADATVDAKSKAVIAIIVESGLRLQELIDLREQDIDTTNRSIRVHGKGNRERIVYYGALTEKYFISNWEFDVTGQRDIRRMVYNALSKHSDGGQLSPHALRHTFATNMLNHNMRIESVSSLLGHKQVTTTQRYARLTNTSLRKEYEQATWQ